MLASDLARRTYSVVVHRIKRARKAGLRRVKFAQDWSGRLRRAKKDLFFRARESDRGRVVLSAASFARAPLEYRERRQVAASYAGRPERRAIDPVKGYGLLSLAASDQFTPVLDTCRRVFAIKKAEIEARAAGFQSWTPEKQAKYLARKQSFLRYLLSDDDLREYPGIVDFALSDVTLGAATQYLGMVPYLSRVDLVYSLPRPGANSDSQLFHLDPEGLTQVKFFIHLVDVGEAEGPFTFIPADDSARILREVRALRARQGTPQSRRYLDEEVAAVERAGNRVAVSGPTGTAIAVDTSRCLHLGSRVQPGTFRLCLYLQYCTTREQTNVFDVKRYERDPVRLLAVNHSIEPGRTHLDAYQMAT
jgi:hypothetical protein